jgi:hypothetical protein
VQSVARERRRPLPDWRTDLADFLREMENRPEAREDRLRRAKTQIDEFFSETVIPAFEELKTELEKYGREVKVFRGLNSASLTVSYMGYTELEYAIKVRARPNGAFPYLEVRFMDGAAGRIYSTEDYFRSGAQTYDIADISKDEIAENFLSDYKIHSTEPLLKTRSRR